MHAQRMSGRLTRADGCLCRIDGHYPDDRLGLVVPDTFVQSQARVMRTVSRI
jgi:hypothetical protein